MEAAAKEAPREMTKAHAPKLKEPDPEVKAKADRAVAGAENRLSNDAIKIRADRAAAPRSVAGHDVTIKDAADRAEERSKMARARKST
jgi:hypothetical protein